MTWRLVPVPLLGKASCLGWLPAACTLTATKSICAFPYGGGLDTLKSAMHLCPFDLSLFSCSVHGPFAVMCSFKREPIWYSVKCPVVPAKPSHWIESAVLFLFIVILFCKEEYTYPKCSDPPLSRGLCPAWCKADTASVTTAFWCFQRKEIPLQDSQLRVSCIQNLQSDSSLCAPACSLRW